MSAEHKEALARGREQSKAVRDYLEALEAHRPRRGRRRTRASVEQRLAAVESELADAEPLQRLSLIQERYDLQAELAAPSEGVDLSDLEATFSKHAKNYSDRKGISYAAWREVGVSVATLRAAGISRSS